MIAPGPALFALVLREQDRTNRNQLDTPAGLNLLPRTTTTSASVMFCATPSCCVSACGTTATSWRSDANTNGAGMLPIETDVPPRLVGRGIDGACSVRSANRWPKIATNMPPVSSPPGKLFAR
ncbi:MAG: hypothetical protein R2748_12450 [Bryobacterales bacterium]